MDWILRYGNPDMVLIAWPTTCRFEWPEEYRKHHSADFGFTKYKTERLIKIGILPNYKVI